MKSIQWALCLFLLQMGSASQSLAQPVFPFYPPEEKPDMELSEAMNRYYDIYDGHRPEKNELYSQFRYSEIKGFDYNGYDGTRNRRDPSKVIRVNNKYYVWYTHNHLDRPSNGVPSSDVWYATSNDGFTWEEQGPAVERPEKPIIGWQAVLTPDILVYKGKYYLYYQAFGDEKGPNKSNPVKVSVANSPDGPWKMHDEIVIPKGKEGEWDQHSIHDPHPFVYKGKIYLYFKADMGGTSHSDFERMHGVAIAENPLGPFKKHTLNPIMNSGHETTLFPFKEGMAAFVISDGNERSTIQYAEDGVNFKIMATAANMPVAAGPYTPDAFTNTSYGRGITWGLCFANSGRGNRGNILLRFDCDLSLDVHDPKMKMRPDKPDALYLYQFGLDEEQRKRIEAQDNPFIGNWALKLPGNVTAWLTLNNVKGQIQGELWMVGAPKKLTDVKVLDDKLFFTHRRAVGEREYEGGPASGPKLDCKHTAAIMGNELLIVMDQPLADGGIKKVKFKGKRIAPLPPRPDLDKLVYGDPVKLFNGKDLSGWELTNPKQINGWKAEDGVLINDTPKKTFDPFARYGNLRTVQEFNNFRLQIDFNVPEGGNSGIYLKGMYEVQVVDRDSRMQGIHGVGAIFNRILPKGNHGKKGGEWQHYDITLVDKHVTVILNGVKVIDNEALEGCTNGALTADESMDGPIYLQGDHTSVSYRNIILTPILK